jgi:hypothetical protein
MKKHLINILLVYTLFSCQKEKIELSDLDFTNAELNYEIAVNGFISTEKTICKVFLSKPVSIMDSIKYTPINNATVTLNDESNTYLFELKDNNGMYASVDSIQGVAGKTYTLEVSYNGKLFSGFDIIPLSVSDEIYLPFTHPIDDEGNANLNDDDWIELSISEHNFGYNEAMMWQNIESTDSLNNIWFIDIYDLYGMRIYTHKGSLPQGVFPAGFSSTGVSGMPSDSLEIIKMAISDEYYDYLLSVFNETDWKTGIFSTISGNVKTNLSQGGTGFFYALNVKRIRLTYKDLSDIIEE